MSDQAPPQTGTPDPAEQGKAIEIGKAMGQAKIDAEGQSPEAQRAAVEQAGREKADEVGLPVTDEQLEVMAGMLFGKLENMFETRGAFDPPPEPVAAPPVAPPAPGTETPTPTELEVPRRKSWAERFAGQ